MERRYVTLKEASAELKISQRSIYYLLRRDHIPVFIQFPFRRPQYILIEDIERLKAKMTPKGDSHVEL